VQAEKDDTVKGQKEGNGSIHTVLSALGHSNPLDSFTSEIISSQLVKKSIKMGMEMKAHPKNCRIIMDASLRRWLIHSQILHFRCTKYDILIWFLNGRNEFGWRPANVIASVAMLVHVCKQEERRVVRRKATEKSTWGYALSDY